MFVLSRVLSAFQMSVSLESITDLQPLPPLPPPPPPLPPEEPSVEPDEPVSSTAITLFRGGHTGTVTETSHT